MTPDMLRAGLAAAARDAAIARVALHTAPGFLAAAVQAITQTARAHPEFIVDEVWKVLDTETHEKRAMGAAMNIARRTGVIAPTNRFISSRQAQCHANPRRVWRSLLWAPALDASPLTP